VVEVTTHGADRFFELRGDSKAASDALVSADAVVGRIVGVRRNGRLVHVCGRAARVRHSARAAASQIKWLMAPVAIALFGVSSRPS
jgi:hypothetical protein